MRKISTLAFMAFFCCMSAMAQVVLGDIKFSIKDGAKLNPTTGKITVTFPDVTGVADPTFNDVDFDEVEGSFASGVTFDLGEFELEPGTEYTLTIASVKVDGAELAAEGGYKLNFKTRGTERKMSWSFVIDEDTKAKIIADDGNDPAYNESNGGNFWKCIKADERHYVHQSLKDSEIMLDAENVFPMAEDLTFNAGADKLFVGDLSGSFKGMLVFNATNLKMTIPDCKVGDVITFSGVNATKGNSSKQTCIYTLNGDAFAPEGLESSRGFVDSVWVSAKGSFKFEAQIDGDISFYFGNFRMTGIEIAEAQPKVARKYNIVAAYTEDETTTTLKELVAQTEGITGSTVKVNYPFWLTDSEANAYTHGARGTEFVESFELKNGEGDTTFVVNYSKTAFSGVAFLSEGEDLTGATLCASNNAVVRSSMGKSAYFAEDVNLCTLQPGTYKIRAVLFDASSTPGYTITLTKGAGEENEIYLTAALVNFSEVETELIEITEATNITIMIYASTDAPEDPDGISEVKDAKKVVARKVAKDGRILIQTAAGTFNAVGVQVK
ncbi:hypothetical protein [uncultured Prevotella sp.]|uniref:Ig-like domain-containing protein n=1 Tax=uncultured Prevotella sp. TaxID=159272 RepID=UPI00258A96B2|nr:hypothetical protein [uncultured Prevotella sp.]